jgi:rubredoxin-NAD+ reductase
LQLWVLIYHPGPRDAAGEWTVVEDGNNVGAEFRDASGALLGFALTCDCTKEKMRLQKELPAILA